jgi:hypothetical protein
VLRNKVLDPPRKQSHCRTRGGASADPASRFFVLTLIFDNFTVLGEASAMIGNVVTIRRCGKFAQAIKREPRAPADD